ncbi:hypothetical protein BSKO_02584 [Bryopsis sp. KO-2023]|nr:hypothetical protein BSKO_02584 [Bryopsis sp. KO-2023]
MNEPGDPSQKWSWRATVDFAGDTLFFRVDRRKRSSEKRGGEGAECEVVNEKNEICGSLDSAKKKRKTRRKGREKKIKRRGALLGN